MKLATRVSKNPVGIVRAYCSGSYSGNIPDLLEPNHAGLFYPQIIENKKIPNLFLKFFDKIICEISLGRAGQTTNL